MSPSTNEQPAPTQNDSRPVWELVIEDMQARDRLGRERYGVPLQAHNGRDALVDAYQEALDLAVYLRQLICEREAQTALAKLLDEITQPGSVLRHADDCPRSKPGALTAPCTCGLLEYRDRVGDALATAGGER